MLAAADVHVARRLAALAGEADERVALAAALAVRGPRLGHVCVDLATIAATASVDTDEPVDLAALPWPEPGDWAGRVAASALAGGPLHVDGSVVHLDRYRREEERVASGPARARRGAGARRRRGAARPPGSTGCCPSAATSGWRPRPRCCAASRSWPAGRARARRRRSRGSSRCSPSRPRARGDAPPLVALAAPTGKAAARLAEAVHDEAAELAVGDAVRAHLLGLSAPRPSTACSAARRGAARCRTTS